MSRRECLPNLEIDGVYYRDSSTTRPYGTTVYIVAATLEDLVKLQLVVCPPEVILLVL
jgi:hypothetical protein